MLREGDVLDPFKKFQTAGKLAKTVAHWKTKGGTIAVGIQQGENKFVNSFLQTESQGRLSYACLKNKREMVLIEKFVSTF